MANGSSGAALIIVTGLSIAAVVGLYANDAIPRRSGPAPSSALSWPSWQSQSSYDQRSYDTPPQPVQSQAAPPPSSSGVPTEARYQPDSGQGGVNPPPQQVYPQQQGYPPQQPQAQGNYPQDVPDENGPPTQQQYQQQPQPGGAPRY